MIRNFITAATLVLCLATFSDRFAFPALSASPEASPYARFVGSWVHHGGGMVVYRSGHGFHSYRIYTNCDQKHVTACDQSIGNILYDGGFTTFDLHRVNAAKAFGTISNSPYSWQVGTPVTLTLGAHDTLTITTVDASVVTCGPRAAPGACGA